MWFWEDVKFEFRWSHRGPEKSIGYLYVLGVGKDLSRRRMAKMNRWKIPSVGKDTEQPALSHTARGSRMDTTTLENCLVTSAKAEQRHTM